MSINSAHYTLRLDMLDGKGSVQCIEALENYFLHALPPGGFLTALLSNDSVLNVVRRGDFENRKRVHFYVDWLVNYAPVAAWGSEEKVKNWLSKGPEYVEFSENIKKQMTWDILNS